MSTIKIVVVVVVVVVVELSLRTRVWSNPEPIDEAQGPENEIALT